jgi:hypothetical protein
MGLTPPSAPPPIWTAGQQYGIGKLMIPPPDKTTSHYYRAENTAKAGAKPPNFSSATNATFPDGPDLTWRDMGPITLNPPPVPWKENAAYATGALIVPNPPNSHYYQASSAGVTGPNAPPFSVDGITPTAETAGIVYIDAGTSLPTNAKLKTWAANTAFFLGDAIQDPTTGHYYSVVQQGISGSNSPKFGVPPQKTIPGGTSSQPIIWQDLGAVLPPAVSFGTPPTDLTVNLLTYIYPQAHALSRFNLASGVVVSTARARNIIPGPTTGTYTETSTSLIVDPILAVTVYPWAIDAERRFHAEDLRPGVTLGLSLSAPTKNFYFGGSSEFFVRNLQLTYGLSMVNTNVLGPTSMGIATTTKQKFVFGGFVGFTFNITGFIQSLIP